MPLRNVPEGCVNVHGHLHNQEAPSRVQHINVSVEQSALPAETVGGHLQTRPAHGCRERGEGADDGPAADQRSLTGEGRALRASKWTWIRLPPPRQSSTLPPPVRVTSRTAIARPLERPRPPAQGRVPLDRRKLENPERLR